MRQGPGTAQPGPVRRPHPVPAEAQRPPRIQPVAAHDVGGSPRDPRHPRPQSHPGRPQRRGHVPRGPSGPRRLHGAGPTGMGGGRPQFAHQYLLRIGPFGVRLVAGGRPALAGLRKCALHPADLGPPRGRPLFQPARPADHGGQDGRGQTDRCRPEALQHRVHGGHLAFAPPGHRDRPVARRGSGDHRLRPLRRRLHEAVGQLAGLRGRRFRGPGEELR